MRINDAKGFKNREERQDQGGAEEDGQQRAERVRQVLEESVNDGVLAASLRAGGGLDVVVRGCGADFIDGRLLISLKTDCTAPPITIW